MVIVLPSMYRIFIFFYLLSMRLAALWIPKARLWLSGRKGLLAEIREQLQEERRPVVWFHCASLGEFEQGRPLIQGVRQNHPGVCILLTFFSPSGYEACKQYEGADHIFYLPMDTPRNARQFIQYTSPVLAVFVKYEFWHYYLYYLKERQIPTLLVSGVFRKDQPFFRWYGGFWRNMLGAFSHLFVQDSHSYALLESLGLQDRATVSGDTRFDRVLEILEQGLKIPAAAAFAAGCKELIVAGSTWNEDEKELAHFIRSHPAIRFIIAPHELSRDHLNDIRSSFPSQMLYSEYVLIYHEKPADFQCLIIDNIGLLSRLYQYGSVTYVGGGFGGDGVHNVLEAAVWSKPVVFGPEYSKYREASELVEAGGGFSASNTLDLEECFNELLGDQEALDQAGRSAGSYIHSKAGATQKVIRYIQEKRLLTN